MATWPQGKDFAFTIFDDPDSQTLEAGRAVYDFLAEYGLRTTRGAWPLGPVAEPSDGGVTCADSHCVEWLQKLQRAGFEIGFHNATSHTSTRENTRRGLEVFASLFGHDPFTYTQHYFCDESLYWGAGRLTNPLHRAFYNLATIRNGRRQYSGHVQGHPYFWGDLCREKIRYVRNFVFGDINTLKACPQMPYHDPLRPYVNYWFASSDGHNVRALTGLLAEKKQERLEREGGACIVYTHFAHGFYENGRLDARFRDAIRRLSRRNGWFVPVATLLDYLLARRRSAEITPAERNRLERTWLLNKILLGAT